MSDSELIPRDLEFEDFVFKRFGRQRLSQSQFGVMVDFMTLNPELIDRKFNEMFTREDWHKKWEELASLLNADFTGARKDAERWRRSWKDQKFIIKAKAAKRDSSKYSYKLTDLEERVLKLLNLYSSKKTVNHNVVKSPIIEQSPINCVPKEMGHTNYVLINLNTLNTPIRLEPANPSSLKLDPVNNLLSGLESRNVTPIRLESSSNLPVRSEASHSVLKQPASVSDLVQNINDIPLKLGTTANSSEMEIEGVQESTEKEKSSSLMVKLQPYAAAPKTVSEEESKYGEMAKNNEQKLKKSINIKTKANSTILQKKYAALKSRMRMRRLWKLKKTPTAFSQCKPTNNSSTEQLHSKAMSEISENSRNSLWSESIQETEITEGNIKDFSSQNSCAPKKKMKVSNHSYFQTKNEFGIVKLLQRQNELLEGIAGTLERIEKSLDDRSSREDQRKNSMLGNISENIEKLAESLGSASKSLKTIAEK